MAYHMNHRGGEIGNYNFEKTGERSAKIVSQNPFPCAFDRGIFEAMARRFKPEDAATVTVKHDDAAACRTKDGESCTYTVEW